MQAVIDELCEQLAASSAQDDSSDLVSRACVFITENIANPDLSVPDVSGAMGVSVQHLARLFRRKLDSTVVEQINSTRIERAKQLLLESGMTVNAIAKEVGYNNNVTFSRNFHRCVGMSPSEFRTVNKKCARQTKTPSSKAWRTAFFCCLLKYVTEAKNCGLRNANPADTMGLTQEKRGSRT